MKRLILLAFVLAAGTSCGPQLHVYSDHDPDYQIQTFSTFDWKHGSDVESGNDPLLYNELNDKRIKAAVNAQLTAKGFVHSTEQPDLVVHYHIIVDDKTMVTADPYGPYWMRMQTHVYQYTEGTLIIDLMDGKTNELVWRGWAKAALEGITPDQVEGIIHKAVGRIFAGFPRSVAEPATDIEGG